MKIEHKIRQIGPHLAHVQPSDAFYVGACLEEKLAEATAGLGFSHPPIPGERLLPSAKYGAASRRNADGDVIIHRDLPKERAIRQIEWHWNEYHGRDVIPRSGIKDVPYERYPRTHKAPFAQELEVVVRADGETFVVSGPFRNVDADCEVATNTANMCVEVFGVFEVLDGDLHGWVRGPVRKLNWEVLPPGRNPFQAAGAALERFVASVEQGNRPIIRARVNHVERYVPEFVAIGKGGFSRYVVFGFPRMECCVLESNEVNNATYVLPMPSWEAVSRMSKAEVLDQKLHRARVVHTRKWFSELDHLLRAAAA